MKRKQIRTANLIDGKIVTVYFKSEEAKQEYIKRLAHDRSDTFNDSEAWRSIPGFSRYEASTDGRLRTLNYKRSGCVRVISPAIGIDGYPQTMLLCDDGKYKSMKVHKFVCLAFLGPRSEGQEVNHKDGNKTNNRPDNLEYCTRSENMIHAFANGLEKPKRGATNGNSKLTDSQVLDIRRTAASGGRYYGRKALAEKYGISQAHVKDIVNNPNLWRGISI